MDILELRPLIRNYARKVARGCGADPDEAESLGLYLLVKVANSDVDHPNPLAYLKATIRFRVFDLTKTNTVDEFPEIPVDNSIEEELFVEEFLRSLSPEERIIVRLRLQGYTIEEVANQVGKSFSSIRHILWRVSRWLKESS